MSMPSAVFCRRSPRQTTTRRRMKSTSGLEQRVFQCIEVVGHCLRLDLLLQVVKNEPFGGARRRG